VTLALVLGGGGSAALGWEIGVLAGLADEGVELVAADVTVGTSAGAIAAVRLHAGGSPEQLFAGANGPPPARPLTLDFAALEQQWATATRDAVSGEDARRRIGEFARAVPTIAPARRRAEIAALLPTGDWPAAAVVVTAVSATSGRFRTFTAADNVALVDAVAASCAVPGVWPPVTIDGEQFMDGAVRSPTNVSVAKGAGRVVVLAPMLPVAASGIDRETAALGTETRVVVLTADAAAVAAFGGNPLDPAVGPAAAREGRRQGRASAELVRGVVQADDGR
jgi:NTE family protein